MTQRSERMRSTLSALFHPEALQIDDDSARHAGHAGADAAGETHYNVALTSEKFTGMSRVARSRAVHEALAAEFADGLHALSLKLKAPGE
ncbi:MAG: BolA family transcriptional regulator [Rhodospirillales bacterium 20-60-12]|nr:MAG: BolA family transcriptional regulator [Rhodospirillales bacterium 20-60-12]